MTTHKYKSVRGTLIIDLRSNKNNIADSKHPFVALIKKTIFRKKKREREIKTYKVGYKISFVFGIHMPRIKRSTILIKPLPAPLTAPINTIVM